MSYAFHWPGGEIHSYFTHGQGARRNDSSVTLSGIAHRATNAGCVSHRIVSYSILCFLVLYCVLLFCLFFLLLCCVALYCIIVFVLCCVVLFCVCFVMCLCSGSIAWMSSVITWMPLFLFCALCSVAVVVVVFLLCVLFF